MTQRVHDVGDAGDASKNRGEVEMGKRLFTANAMPAGSAGYAGALYAGQPLNSSRATERARALLRSEFTKPAALTTGRPIFGSLNFLRSMAQGACAGLLSLLGVMHLTASLPEGEQSFAGLFNAFGSVFASSALTEAGTLAPGLETNLAGAVERILAGGMPGILELMGAAALFLNAGRGMARILGLLGFVAIVAAHANGVTHADLLDRLTSLADRAQTLSDGLENSLALLAA